MRTVHDLPSQKAVRRKLREKATPQEVILWSYLRNKQLGYRFRRQASIGPYIVDFYCPDKKLVIEVDGSQHQEQVDYDEKRSAYLSSLGLQVIRFWNNEINANLKGVLLRIEEVLEK